MQGDDHQPAAIIATDVNASAIPIVCGRDTRSRSTTIASTTVAAGYSAIRTPASESIPYCSANSVATLAIVSSTAAVSANRNGTPRSMTRLAVSAAANSTIAVAASLPNTRGQRLAST